MATIPVNLGTVEAFSNIPDGEYLGEIEKLVYQEAKPQPGKFPSIRAVYIVTQEGESLGKRQSEFLSFSPKAIWRMKKWFMMFGLGDLPAFEIDDDSKEVLEPSLNGIPIIFSQAKDGDQSSTTLLSVEEDMSAGVAPVAAAPAAPAVDTAAEEAAAAARAEKKAARLAAAQAALEAAQAEDEDEDEVEAAPAAPAPARRVAKPVAPAAEPGKPQRRTLR